MITIKVKLINKLCTPVIYPGKGDWIDLKVGEDITLKAPELVTTKEEIDGKVVQKKYTKFDSSLINLGVAMKLPDHFEAICAPRSSTFKTFKIILANSIGVIDNSYSGSKDEWKFMAIAFDNITIPRGARIAQFRIQPNQFAPWWVKLKWVFSKGVELKFVEDLDKESRGGIGSTGIK